MPELINLYQAHAEHRDKFEVLAIHDKTVKSFAELDEKLVKIKDRYWEGKDLPFPVLLDASGKTEELYGISAHPTGLLIDPEGKVVGEFSSAELEAKLPRLPASTQWSRHCDRAVFFSQFEPSNNTLNKFVDILKKWTRCAVELDSDAIKPTGLKPDGPLPGAVFGAGISLRSLDELLLAPHGLGVVPSSDEKKLRITKRPTKAQSESTLQKVRAKEITDLLDHKSDSGADDKAKPLVIKDVSLLEAIQRIQHEFSLSMALDAYAMHSKALDPAAKVSGRIGPNDLRHSLTKLLESLGLMIEVRHEVVLVIPKKR